MKKLHAKALINFDTIRRSGSIRAAARQLHMSSSTLNRQLLELEAQIGAPLFERLRTGLVLTPSGEVLARHVIHVIQDADRVSSELQALRGLQAGHINLVTVEALTRAFIPSLMGRMADAHPRVTLSTRIYGSRLAAESVANGSADVAISFLQDRNPELHQFAVAPFQLGAVVSPSHPLSGKKSVAFSECAPFPLVLPTAELSIYQTLQPLLRSAQAPLDVTLETSSFELMRQMAVRGRAIAFVNRFGIEEDLQKGRLLHLPLKKVAPSLLGVYVRAGRSLPKAVQAFCQFAADELGRYQKRVSS